MAGEVQVASKWDKNLLDIELKDVTIYSDPFLYVPGIVSAWQQITVSNLIRANICLDAGAYEDKTLFKFKKEKTTGREVFEALIAAYPAYTFTQDALTGVIWIHPKSVNYTNLLNKQVEIMRPVLQIPMDYGVLQPLIRVLYPPSEGMIGNNPFSLLRSFSAEAASNMDYCVDIPSGIYSCRDILNFCSVASPNWAFEVQRGSDGLFYIDARPLSARLQASERIPAIKFWETEIGDTTNAPPSNELLTAVFSDSNPRKRWAAREYLRATEGLSHGVPGADPRLSEWTHIGVKYVQLGDMGEWAFFSRSNPGKDPAILHQLMPIEPGLALLVSMELAREEKDASLMDVVQGHKLTQTEMAAIKPDLYRIARESTLVRDKLAQMKFDLPDLSPEALNELSNTNWFRPLSAAKN